MGWRETMMMHLGPGALGGVTFRHWLRLLWDNGFRVHPRHWVRAMTVTRQSFSNSLWRRWEDFRFGQAIVATEVPPPLFVLGIWRSGTTHLHNLLTKDERFAFPTSYQVCFPHSFLTTERLEAPLMSWMMPRVRPQDNVAMALHEPQEEEFALVNMTNVSSYLAWVFPRRAAVYDRYLTFREATADEIARWQAALRRFVQKVTFKYGRPLVLKSPGHTARIRLLLELFPRARFVHIRRHPLAVFRSWRHLMRRAEPWWALQRHDFSDLDERILRQYREVYEAYFEQRGLIPAGHLCEVAYEDLERDPLGELRRVYQELSLPDFAVAEPAVRAYADSLGGYQKNQFTPLEPELQDRIARDWRQCFDAWGYSPKEPSSAVA
jgi:hypothetical protein